MSSLRGSPSVPGTLTRFPELFFFMLPAVRRTDDGTSPTFTGTPLFAHGEPGGAGAEHKSALNPVEVGQGGPEPPPQLRRSSAAAPGSDSARRPAAGASAGFCCTLTSQQPLRDSVSGYSSSPVSPLAQRLIGSPTAPPSGGQQKETRRERTGPWIGVNT